MQTFPLLYNEPNTKMKYKKKIICDVAIRTRSIVSYIYIYNRWWPQDSVAAELSEPVLHLNTCHDRRVCLPKYDKRVLRASAIRFRDL